MRFPDHARARRKMVRRDLAGRGISDRRVLAAMWTVPREHFLASDQAGDAYADRPLVIGAGQTISQPYIVALMTQAARLSRRAKVLEIGTGSGYHAAVLARIAGHVWTIERVPELAAAARRRLASLDVTNVTVLQGDGAHGYAPCAPYDAIVVAAAAGSTPPALLAQLRCGGRLIIPVGSRDLQELTVYRRTEGGLGIEVLCSCVFVPLVISRGPDLPRWTPASEAW